MPDLKVWNGSAFVNGAPKIWNGSAFVNPGSAWIWDGSAFVKVWPAAPISFVSSAYGIGAVPAMPSHQANDLIIAGGVFDSGFSPTLSAGFTDFLTKDYGDSRVVLASKIATTSSESMGSWGGAYRVLALVYRGAIDIGALASNEGTSGTITYPALTFENTDNTSWGVRMLFLGSSISASPSAPPNTLRIDQSVQKTYDSNGPISSMSSATQGSTGKRSAISLELKQHA